MNIFLNNTLTGTKEEFTPITPGVVSMYHCGPTVYNFPTIGNMRSYVFADILRRTFEYFGNEVKQVINITDVGHLVGDGDEGEDKVAKTAKSQGKTVEEIAQFYEKAFYKDLRDLNIETTNTEFPKATKNIPEQIEIIKILEDKGLTYRTSDGIYFDTGNYPAYGKLGGVNKESDNESRIGENSEKKNSADFALWKFSKSEDNRLQEWESPWGIGFPGWHIECSAMSKKFLGQPFDIHTGGVDHIPVHHNNEIAQSEGAYDVPLANVWMHNEFLRVDNEKMSKSLGNTYTLADLKEHKIHPLSFRYWLLMGKYNTPMNFTWEALQGAQKALEKLVINYTNLPMSKGVFDIKVFEDSISDDFNTPVAISLLQESNSQEEIDKMDQMLGLNIKVLAEEIQKIPENILDLQKQRDEARKSEDWKLSDELRDKIEHVGFIVKDNPEGTLILRSLSSLLQ
jgi:cysteinyl-tRNA synthetase